MKEEKLSVSQKLFTIIRGITVEVVAFLFQTGSLLASTASQTLNLDKACRVNLNLSEAICDAVRYQNTDDNADNERLVQQYVARLVTYRSIITSVVPCFILIFAGGWMDLTGRRKLVMLIPVIGELLVQTSNIINVIFFYELKVEFLMFFDASLTSLFGAWTLLFVVLFSYIVDITTEENRTYRLGFVSFCLYISSPIGMTLSGVLLSSFGYLTVYITSMVLSLLNLSYILIFVAEPPRKKEQKEHDNRGLFYFLKTLFSPMHFINSLKVVFKKTANNRTLKLCIFIATAFLVYGPIHGEGSIVFMSTRYRFGWDELQFSLFQAYNTIVNSVGTLFCIIVISKKLGWDDSVLGILSTISKMASTLIFCFAATGAIFYIGATVDLFNGVSYMAIRSILSKTVENSEIGRLNSVVSIFEVIVPLGYVPLYQQTYIATMEWFPGFAFLLGPILLFPPLLVFTWLLYKHLKKRNASEVTPL